MTKWIIIVVGGALLLSAAWELFKLILLALPSGRAMHRWARAGLPAPFASEYLRPKSPAHADRILSSLLSTQQTPSDARLIIDAAYLESAIRQLLQDPARLASLDRLGAAAYQIVEEEIEAESKDAEDEDDEDEDEWYRRVDVVNAWKTTIAVAGATNDRATIELLRPVVFQGDGELRPGVIPALIASRSVEALRFAQTFAEKWRGRHNHDQSVHMVLEERKPRPNPAWRAEMVKLLDRARSLETEFRATLLHRQAALTPERQQALGLVLDFDSPKLAKQLRRLAHVGASVPLSDLRRVWDHPETHGLDSTAAANERARSRLANDIVRILSRSTDPRGLTLLHELLQEPIFSKTAIADVHLAAVGLPPLCTLAEHAFDDDAASRPERVAARVVEWDDEVSNGGVLQYFVNSSAESWRELMETFELVGATECAQILREAVAILGGAERLTNRKSCAAAVGRLSEASSKRMDDLATRYYSSRKPGGPGVELMQATGAWIARHAPEVPESRLAGLKDSPRVE